MEEKYFHPVFKNARQIYCKKTALFGDDGEYSLYLFVADGGRAELNGSRYAIGKNTVIFSRREALKLSNCEFLLLQFTADESCELLNKIPPAFYSEKSEIYKEIIKKIIVFAIEPEKIGAFAKITAEILSLLAMIYEENCENSEKLDEAKRFLEDNFSKKLSLDDLGEHFGYNPLYFFRIFKEKFRVSPHEYLFEYRMKKACGYLLTTSLPAADISKMCGFQSVSHFSQSFKNKFGVTPYAYRKNR